MNLAALLLPEINRRGQQEMVEDIDLMPGAKIFKLEKAAGDSSGFSQPACWGWGIVSICRARGGTYYTRKSYLVQKLSLLICRQIPCLITLFFAVQLRKKIYSG